MAIVSLNRPGSIRSSNSNIIFTEQRIEAEQVLSYLQENADNGGIKTLSCDAIWTDEDVNKLDVFIRNNKIYIQKLKLPNNNLTESSAASLARILSSPQIKELDLSDNNVRSKGLAKLKLPLMREECALQVLDLSNNKLGAACGSHLLSILQHNTSIKTLRLARNQLGKKGLKNFLPALCKNKTLEKLDISQNAIGDSGATLFAQVLDSEVSESRLVNVNLSHNKIGHVGIRDIAGAILKGSNKCLRYLDVSMNHIGASGAESIGVLLKFSYTIEKINLARNEIGDEGVEAICQGLESQEINESALTHLNLDWNSIHCQGAKRLAQLLMHDAVLTHLSLESNGIANDGAMALAKALNYNQTLRDLNLVGNQIQDAGATYFAESWCQPTCKLEKVSLEMNCLTSMGEGRIKAALAFRRNRVTWLGRILRQVQKYKTTSVNMLQSMTGDDDVLAVASQVARYKPKITTWTMGGSMISGRGMQGMTREVLSNRSVIIERLYIQNANLGPKGVALLAQGLAVNVTLRVFSMNNGSLDTEGAHTIAQGLRRNMHLIRLNLCRNSFGDSGAQELLSATLDPPHPSLVALNLSNNNLSDAVFAKMPSIQRLQELILSNNEITDCGALDLCKVFTTKTSLHWLDISANKVTNKGVKALQVFVPKKCIIECDESQK